MAEYSANFLFKEWLLLSESKQRFLNLGLPAVFYPIFQQLVGKYANIVGKWYKDYRDSLGGVTYSDSMRYAIERHAALPNEEKYKEVLRKQGDKPKDNYDPIELEELKQGNEKEIKSKLLNDVFWSRPFVQAILSKEINPNDYKDFNYKDASEKYENKFVIHKTPVKEYPNGMRWINVGRKCDLVGEKMGNCGSTGVMAGDTLFVLFDENDDPLVITSYKTSDKEFSAVEGKNHQPVAAEYDKYVVDLLKTMGASLAYARNNIPRLSIKSFLGSDDIREVARNVFSFEKNGKNYYSDGLRIITPQHLEKVKKAIENGQFKSFESYKDSPDNLATAITMSPRYFEDLVDFIPLFKLPSL